jgi:hypothetical protein
VRGEDWGDEAQEPLFEHIDESFLKKDTVKHFMSLLDNYDHKCGRAEKISKHERDEVQNFLKSVCGTEIMQFCCEWLRRQGVFEGEIELYSVQSINQ